LDGYCSCVCSGEGNGVSTVISIDGVERITKNESGRCSGGDINCQSISATATSNSVTNGICIEVSSDGVITTATKDVYRANNCAGVSGEGDCVSTLTTLNCGGFDDASSVVA